MKNLYIMIMAVLLASYAKTNLMEASVVAVNESEQTNGASICSNDFQSLVDKARWGDGQAFLDLADCYRDGIGVKKDFISMLKMAFQAEEIGSVDKVENYIQSLPEDNEYRMIFEIMNKSSCEKREESDSIIAKLQKYDSPEGQALRGVVKIEIGDTIAGLEMIGESAKQGFSLAKILLAMYDERTSLNQDNSKLIQLTDEIPFTNKLLGDECVNIKGKEKQAAYYYLKAEKYAMLNKGETDWLLSYFKNGGDVQLSDEDVKRLESFSSAHTSKY